MITQWKAIWEITCVVVSFDLIFFLALAIFILGKRIRLSSLEITTVLFVIS